MNQPVTMLRVTKLCVCVKDGVWHRWCVKESATKMCVEDVACSRWCVTKMCVKDGVYDNGV